jgi:IclR family transcriptional regulator, acetate operon repressor
MRSDQRNGASVLDRAFRLLDVFGPDGGALGLAELARRSGLPKATAHRLAAQLIELGALERAEDKYRLGIRLFEIGSRVGPQRRLREAALPFLEDLYEATHETVHLGVLDGLRVLYIEKIRGRRGSPVRTQVGTHKPLHCTALGKAILAYSPPELVQAVIDAGLERRTAYTICSAEALLRELAAVARNGVAQDREEYALGTTCAAAPIIDQATGYAKAALSITGPPTRFHPGLGIAPVRAAAAALTGALDGIPWPP